MPRSKLDEYPIDFFSPNGEKMQNVLDSIGLPGRTANDRSRSSRIRTTLIARSLLFSMMRPVDLGQRTAPYAYLHPEYTLAAFDGIPALSKDQQSDRWLRKTVVPHLQDFATRPEARSLISQSLATHYNRIAVHAVKLPNEGDEIWIRGHKIGDGVDPMALVGVSARMFANSYPGERYNLGSDHGRTFFRIMKVAEHIGWTIPGVETIETRQAILDGFSATNNPDRIVDPLALFMAGTVRVDGFEERTSEVFA